MSQITTAPKTGSIARPKPSRGLNAYYLRLELKRQLKQPTTLFFGILLPVMFYALFGSMPGTDQMAGHGNVNGVIVCFMAIYGASMTAAEVATSLAFDRPMGWSRELRLTPLRPWAFITTKVLNAMLGAVLSMGVLFVVALAWGLAQMPAWLWLAGLGIGFVCGVTFGAFGLMAASLTEGPTAIGILIPVLLFSCFMSGLFSVPLTGNFFATLQKIVPLGGPVNLVLALFGPQAVLNGTIGGMGIGDWRIWANLIGWLAVFLLGAAIAYSRDTKRQ